MAFLIRFSYEKDTVYTKQGGEGVFFDTPAVILKRTRMNDTDMMITLFTKKGGIMQAVAKGARNPKSQLSSATQPFVFGNYIVATGDTYNRMTSGETVLSFYKLREDMARLSYGSYICELVLKTLEEGQLNQKLFTLLVETLSLLEKEDAEPSLLKVTFEIQLLRYIGFPIQMGRCTVCGKEPQSEEDPKFFAASEGGYVCLACHQGGTQAYSLGGTLPKLLTYLAEKDIRIVANTQINVSYVKKLDKIIREYMDFQLELGRLKTREFMDTLNIY